MYSEPFADGPVVASSMGEEIDLEKLREMQTLQQQKVLQVLEVQPHSQKDVQPA